MKTKLITTITIPATKGLKTIARSDIFSYLDSDFENWGTDKKDEKKTKTTLEVREITKDATYAQMMSQDNVLTQEQILYFIENHKDLLRQDGYATFFPFKSGNDFFVACVRVRGGGLEANVFRFSHDCVWHAGSRHRVVQQLTPSISEKTLDSSDTLPLELELSALVRIEGKVDKLLNHLGIGK